MKRLFLSILLCVFVWGMKAQEMDAVFVAMPDQYVPQLENAWRKDLIDLYNSGKVPPACVRFSSNIWGSCIRPSTSGRRG